MAEGIFRLKKEKETLMRKDMLRVQLQLELNGP
jgi:hypothetical protein